MADAITLEQLANASLDAQALETAINADDNTDVTTRLDRQYPSLAKAMRLIVENSLIGATPFTTYAQMTESSLANDSYAVVTNDSDVNKNGIYQKKDGQWQLSKYNPTVQLLNQMSELDAGYNQVIHDADGNKYDFAIVNDILKKIAWGMSNTTMIAPNHRLEFDDELSGFSDSVGRSAMSVRPDGAIQLGSLMLESSQTGAISIQDQAGRAALRISPSGTVSIYDLQSPSLVSTSSKPNLQVGWQRKDINTVIVYGQSLSDGSVSSTGESSTGNEISTTQPYANVMLAGGTRSEPQHSFYSTDFAPLVEQSIGQFSDSGNKGTYNTSQNESPVSGTCNEFTRRCLANSQKATPQDFVMCGMASGRGGQSLENLTDGTQFAVVEQHIKDTANTAKAQSKTQALSAIVFIQGEANHHAILRDLNSFDPSITADIYEYQRRVERLINKIDDVAIANCENQDYLPYVFTYQTEAHRSYNYTGTEKSLNENPIATAQWFMSRSNERFVLAIPAYALPKNNRDKVHLTHLGSWLMGAYIARAMEYTMHRKQGKWRPLEPTHYNWTDTHCDIEFYVPCGQLVFDTFFCAQQPNQGFDVWIDKELQASAISAVTLLDSKTVRVSFSAPQPANAQLSYALGRQETAPNSYGNLRDTHGDSDIVTDPLNNQHKLHNPSIMFNIHKTRGFI
ncbi:hypothetical protein [Psychrobacter sp. I-STPA6b]|uniref:hypothetical protein n=1 Tax=Psychrobacter sp. I-STPA6b TaxID=2585718 RepID=UPI001D0BFC7F|nr:hypothetical protein [Psychrobacter sp. I-STPA6b]